MQPKKVLSLFVILFVATTGSAFAGTWSSGGGSAVVCFQDAAVAKKVQSEGGLITNEELPGIVSIEMLDLFEWKRPRGMEGTPNLPLAEPRPGEKYTSFLKRITDRAYNTIGQHSSSLEGGVGNYLYTYQALFTDITARNIEWTGTSLVHLGDEGTPMRFGGNCTLVPLAVQEGEGYDLRLFIDDRLFFHPKHSEQSRTALFVHEFLYAMAHHLGQTDSSRTRQAMGWMMQNDPATRIEDVRERLEQIGLIDPTPGIRNLHPYAQLHLVSMLSYMLHPYDKDLEPTWMSDQFRASAAGRTEGEIVGDVLALMKENGVANRELRRFNANKAIAYLDFLPASERREALRQQLREIVGARAHATMENISRNINQNGLKERLEYLGYVSAVQTEALGNFIRGPILDMIAKAAEFTGTEAQMELARKENTHLAYPVVSFEDLFTRKSPDGHFTEWSYWLDDLIAWEATRSYHPELDLYGLQVPLL